MGLRLEQLKGGLGHSASFRRAITVVAEGLGRMGPAHLEWAGAALSATREAPAEVRERKRRIAALDPRTDYEAAVQARQMVDRRVATADGVAPR